VYAEIRVKKCQRTSKKVNLVTLGKRVQVSVANSWRIGEAVTVIYVRTSAPNSYIAIGDCCMVAYPSDSNAGGESVK
jgi:hypothetical protein